MFHRSVLYLNIVDYQYHVRVNFDNPIVSIYVEDVLATQYDHTVASVHLCQ